MQNVTKNTTRRSAYALPLLTMIGCLTLLFLQSGCAQPSLGEQPWLQETLEGQCPSGELKECRVWGGNKFQKRYEYCGCAKRG